MKTEKILQDFLQKLQKRYCKSPFLHFLHPNTKPKQLLIINELYNGLYP